MSKDKVWQEMSKMDIFGSGSGLPHFCLTRVFRAYTLCYSGYFCYRSAFAPVDGSKSSNAQVSKPIRQWLCPVNQQRRIDRDCVGATLSSIVASPALEIRAHRPFEAPPVSPLR